ncbi:MAG: nicotinate-nucleotide--dimethylbenzimidazole phosphoribosyltransferase [Bacteroidales bacterium]|nr:nicotinate-nucleotide--dimethylbenzimidazole phosphoribosyltransferase [Bacteroidales bacterium]
MREFNIASPCAGIVGELQNKIDNLTKPKGSLGMLEELALKVGTIQQSLSPELKNPQHILFGADHGIWDEGVSCTPKEVTWQQMGHFLAGGAGISFLCAQHGFKLNVVDSGVDFDFPAGCGIVDAKIRKGTRNFLYGPAMTMEELELAIERGAEQVDRVYAQGCNVVCFGEMGAGNTSPSSMWMSFLGGIPLKECVGAGSGVVGEALQHKVDVLEASAKNYREKGEFAGGKGKDFVLEIMRWFGGYEMVMAVGGMLRAAELGMIILVDGFIMTNCILAARELYPAVVDYAIYGHCGDETGHRKVLDVLGAKPILSLGLRLGEGSGAICAYPIVVSAVNMINQMDSFAAAAVKKYF